MQFKQKICMLFFALFFTACCEISEEITLTKKGNGQAKISINAKESAPLIAFFMAQAGQQIMPDMPPVPTMAEIDAKTKIVIDQLNKADNGITNAQFSFDFAKAQFEFSADFASVDAWNKALASLELDGLKMQTLVHYSFSPEEGTFTRKLTPEIAKQLQTLQKNPAASPNQILSAFQNARYRFYLAYEKQIRGKSENHLYLKGEKEVSMLIRLGELFAEPQKLDFKIKL